MTLAQVPTGIPFTILSIPDPLVRLQILRVGFGEGIRAVVQTRVPGSPVILRRGSQEFALGRRLAQAIEVRLQPQGGVAHGRFLS